MKLWTKLFVILTAGTLFAVSCETVVPFTQSSGEIHGIHIFPIQIHGLSLASFLGL
jgi:hypothetical protein